MTEMIPLTALKSRHEDIPEYTNPFSREKMPPPKQADALQSALQDVFQLYTNTTLQTIPYTMREGVETPEACGDLYQSLTVANVVEELPYNLPHVFVCKLLRKRPTALLLGYVPAQTMWFVMDVNHACATCSQSLLELICECV